MQQCSNCGHRNRAGIVFCENCGASLIGKSPLNTKSLDASSDKEKAEIGIDTNVLKDAKVQGTTLFEEGASLRLDIQGSSDPILLKPKTETIFGRRDPATGATPDVDLTPFAGYRQGVSRRHAAIRTDDEQGLDLWDLGSSNGTFLNNERLQAHRPYPLRDGDEIRLGSMSIRVYFQTEDAMPAARETALGTTPTSTSGDARSASEAATPSDENSAESKPPANDDAKENISTESKIKPISQLPTSPANSDPQPGSGDSR